MEFSMSTDQLFLCESSLVYYYILFIQDKIYEGQRNVWEGMYDLKSDCNDTLLSLHNW